ncbi:MAG TPA: hypothetical protein VFD06_09985 [Candidatus Polarisedimenticolia bacterium]|nr:hypothetical protein [Candidatus Polarisedimenticolia bacterium]
MRTATALRTCSRLGALSTALLFAATIPAVAQDVSQRLSSNLNGRTYEPTYVFFTAQGSEAILNLSRVNAVCVSTMSCTTDTQCAASLPGTLCRGTPLRCQGPVDALLGQAAVIRQSSFCELAACAGASIGTAGCAGVTCPPDQSYCGSPGSCHTCPQAEALCLCDIGGLPAACPESDAVFGPAVAAFNDGFDDGTNPNHWSLMESSIAPNPPDTRLVLGTGAALPSGASIAAAGVRFAVQAGQTYVLFLKRAVDPRAAWVSTCFPSGDLSLFLASRAPLWCDQDDDGFDGTDCDPGNGQAWAIPGEPGDVAFSIAGGVTTLGWAQPVPPGGTPAGIAYRVYAGSRADLPNLLNVKADSCLVADTPGLSAPIVADPAPGTLAWYLVRAADSCGEGTAGNATAGPRIQDARSCDDTIACTIDSCDSSLGCVNAPSDAACDDSNPCTTDSCNPASGCVHTNNTAPCSDGSACTTNDACSGGACLGGPPPSCDDGNVCTDDSCIPSSGCAHANSTSSCDNGNGCCVGGVCTGGSPANHLVISQVQTQGDGVPLSDDEFVEIYNPTGSAISLSGLSLQFKSPMGATYLRVLLPALSIPSHGWFLVARSAYNGVPAADQIQAAFAMGGGGNLFLVNGTTLLSGTCSTDVSIIDKVSYGGGTCPEGAVAPASGADNSIVRNPGGICGNGWDTNDNSADFRVQVPSTPRNRFSTPQP